MVLDTKLAPVEVTDRGFPPLAVEVDFHHVTFLESRESGSAERRDLGGGGGGGVLAAPFRRSGSVVTVVVTVAVPSC